MCGIAGIYLRNPDMIKRHDQLEYMVDNLFLEIEARGKHASGYVAVTRDNKVAMEKTAVAASEFIKTRNPLPLDTKMVLLHTRYTTKGTEKDNINNHPVVWGTCFVTHNGSINNDDHLFETRNFKRMGEVDTEIIPALLSHTDYTLDSIRDAFKDLRGSMAIAAVDPIKNPGKLILARTDNSPLVYVDKGPYIIWASLEKAIQEAWGRVIGTPPKWKNIKRMPMHTAMEVSDSGVTFRNLERPPVVVHRAINQVTQQRSLFTGTAEPKWHPADMIFAGKPDKEQWHVPFIAGNIIGEETARLRKLGRGIADLFEERFDNSKNFQDRLGPWVTCIMCDQKVNGKNIKATTRGDVCVDCRLAWVDLAKAALTKSELGEVAKGTITQKELEDDTDQVVFNMRYDAPSYSELFEGMQSVFPVKAASDLDTWAQDEEYFHSETLREMERHLEFSASSLDFLMFRMGRDQVTKSDIMEEYVDKCREIYLQIYLDLWSEYEEDADEEDKVIDALVNPVPLPLLEAPKEPAKKPFRAIIQPSSPPPKKKSCAFCKHKPTLALACTDVGVSVDYCKDHWHKCAIKGCKCEPNHIRADGIRVCHNHARGMKEVYSDNAMEKMGYTIGSVR